MLGSPTFCRCCRVREPSRPRYGGTTSRGESTQCRSAALFARARQLTPEASKREVVRLSIRYRSAALALVFLLIAGADASADSGGATAPVGAGEKMVSCSGLTNCSAPTTVVRGGKLVVRGRRMTAVRRVLFAGAPGHRDDVAASVSGATTKSAEILVPSKARTGPVTLQSAQRRRLGLLRRVRVLASSLEPAVEPGSGSAFYYGSGRKPTYAFTVTEPSRVVVELISDETQATVGSWTVSAQPGAPQSVTWNGTAAGRVAPTGRYRFRVVSGPAAPVADTATAFSFADNFFPIRGPHDLGQSPTNGFGGGGQRRHMGQDMFAACGTKLVAARGGTVRFAGYQAAAGNYVVIDGSSQGSPDYVYMHMRKPSPSRTGDRVLTGQSIGEVGETGRASGCHLHFELWSSPGWYVGGKAFDPLPSLRQWDAFS